MSRSAGPGSPITFMCARLRRKYYLSRRAADYAAHQVVRTGRERSYRAPRFSALGLRSSHTSREYVCSCGHRGWSNHFDLAQRPLAEGAE